MAETAIESASASIPGSPAISLETAKQEPSKPSDLPPVTTGTSEYYIQGLARAISRASASDPLTVLFETENLPFAPSQSAADLDPAAMQRIVHAAALGRLAAKIPHGAFVAEAGGFAAVACWEPTHVDAAPRTSSIDYGALAERRPAFAEFLARFRELKDQYLRPVAERSSAGRYWHLCLMGRDPGVPYVPGAVRAVLVPFMRRWTSAGGDREGGVTPVWLEAGNERARDVYTHFGFREVGEVEIQGVKTWGMIYTGDIELGLE
ncbi:hypothetical protein AAE478_005732 [Parahypoxylon ruwenzoriense]